MTEDSGNNPGNKRPERGPGTGMPRSRVTLALVALLVLVVLFWLFSR